MIIQETMIRDDKRSHKKIYMSFLWLIVSALCIFTALLLIIDTTKPDYYNLLFLLPLFYLLVFNIVYSQFNNIACKISTSMILGVYGARMVAVPLVMYIGSYSTYGVEGYYYQYMDIAITLMCYEALVIFFFLLFICKKFNQELNYYNEHNRITLDYSPVKLPRKVKLLITLVFLYIVLILIGTPGLLKESFFLTTGRSDESYGLMFSGVVSHNAFGLSFGSQLVTLAFTMVWIAQVLLPPLLLENSFLKVKSSRISTIYFLMILVATLLISTEGRAHSIESALALIFAAAYMYKDRIKINYPLLILIVVGVTIYGLSDKSGVGTSSELVYSEFSTMLSAYFSGPHNVATAIAASIESSDLGFLRIFSDFLQRIPYATKYFTAIWGGTSNVVFNNFFGGIYLGQIIPSIGMGYSYFGFILAPIIPCIAVYFSAKFEMCALKSPDIIRKNLFYLGVIMMARATAMSNMLSGVTYLGNFFMAWVVVYLGFKKAEASR